VKELFEDVALIQAWLSHQEVDRCLKVLFFSLLWGQVPWVPFWALVEVFSSYHF
jgi:hypothetical protein